MFLRFTGHSVHARFDVSTITNPPQIYARLDGGRPTRFIVDRADLNLAPRGLPGPVHTLELDVKDVDERADRWVVPLRSGLQLTGFQLDPGGHALPMPAPGGPRMEFLGDSITQGVRAVSPQIGPDGSDATRDYAWLVGSAFRADFAQVGFGAQGVVVSGCGNVPPAPAAFPYNFDGSPVDPSFVPDAVVVNQGTNDGAVASDRFVPAYVGYLRQLRATWPAAMIFTLRPFNGAHASDIRAAVTALADARIAYVDTTGWLRTDEFTDGLHPTVAGHVAVARRLRPVIAARTGWPASPVPGATTELLAAGSAPGFESGRNAGWQPGSYLTSVAVTPVTPPGGAAPYDGTWALAATSAVAPMGEWRRVTLTPRRPIRLPASARNVFAYVVVASGTTSFFDARLTVRSGRRTFSETIENIPNLSGALPWDRVHVDLPRLGAQRIDALTISVRGEGTSASGALSFQVDDVGWTDRVDRAP